MQFRSLHRFGVTRDVSPKGETSDRNTSEPVTVRSCAYVMSVSKGKCRFGMHSDYALPSAR